MQKYYVSEYILTQENNNIRHTRKMFKFSTIILHNMCIQNTCQTMSFIQKHFGSEPLNHSESLNHSALNHVVLSNGPLVFISTVCTEFLTSSSKTFLTSQKTIDTSTIHTWNITEAIHVNIYKILEHTRKFKWCKVKRYYLKTS